ncbi:MAG TPA: OmpH family outer membrane protein [Syntrophales bacterium]|nr:OmpH family outer membrane protein [Syntrophales bacterium]HOL59334.1 OmpH family outer membrane protein [Syntrophales bacterium]HPO35473.1 OmpH family outer membrane protein [Syntrophales bacterium]
MKKSCLILIVAIIFLMASPLFAQVGKIGFFNMEDILNKSEAGKQANEELKKVFEENKKKIQEREKELYRLKEELEKQKSVLTEKAFREKENNYNKKFRDYQDLVKDANDEMNTKRQELVNKFVPHVLKIVESIGKKEGYSAILDLASVPIAYYNKDNDLTQKIIEEFNKTVKKK